MVNKKCRRVKKMINEIQIGYILGVLVCGLGITSFLAIYLAGEYDSYNKFLIEKKLLYQYNEFKEMRKRLIRSLK